MTLVAHYPLTEDSGSTAYDYSGNENHGSITGAGPAGTGTVTGPVGQTAYEFDSTDDYVDTGANDNITGQITVSLWANLPSWTDTHRVLASAGWDGTNTGWELRTGNQDHDSDGTPELSFGSYDGTNGHRAWVHGENLPTNEWIYLTGLYDGSSWDIYVNGVNTTDGTVNEDGTGLTTSSANRYIGAIDNNGSVAYSVGGYLADVRIYNRALSPNEIQYLYETSKSTQLVTSVK